MQFIPADAYQYLHMMMGGGMNPPASGTGLDADFYAWQEAQKQHITKTNAPSSSTTSFYLVLSFPQGDFADRIDDHAEMPMWVPASGTNPQILGVFGNEKEAILKMEEDRENVHVQYNFRLEGRKGIVEFLEFMAKNDMMTPSSGR